MTAKILIVDDEPNVLNALERLLQRDGNEIIQADGGKQAISALEKHEDIAVIISDQRMPYVTGLEVLKEARYKRPEAVRIALTGYADQEIILKCINEARVSQFLLKPWDDEALLQVVCESVTIYQMKTENKRLQEVIYEQNQKLQAVNTSLEQKVSERAGAIMKARQSLEEAVRGIVEALSELMDMHSTGLRGHGQRVALLSKQMAETLKQPTDEVELIESAALLHDIGKISIPPALLSKQRDLLTRWERGILQRHTVIGHEVLKDIPAFEKIAQIVRHHHEAFSGKGHPDGLAGDEIPLGSRIIAIADMFDSNIFPVGRVVRGSRENAETELKKSLGSLLDTCLVKVFLEDVLPKCGEYSINEVEVSVEMLKPGMVLARDVLNLNGIPLLKAGSMLDDKFIERLHQKDEFDPVFTRIFITGGSLPQETAAVPVWMGDQTGLHSNVAQKPIVDTGTTGKTIVIVDDQLHVVNALKREIREAGYKAIGFTHVTDAFHYIHDNKDVFMLITDFMMPGMTGDKFLAEVQKERPDLPCIVITGAATRETMAKLMQSAKVIKVLPKPWDKQILIETLKELEMGTDLTGPKTETALVE